MEGDISYDPSRIRICHLPECESATFANRTYWKGKRAEHAVAEEAQKSGSSRHGLGTGTGGCTGAANESAGVETQKPMPAISIPILLPTG
jgi:hypothetical protein